MIQGNLTENTDAKVIDSETKSVLATKELLTPLTHGVKVLDPTGDLQLYYN